jgi:soluble lytic murein transglycosylase
VLLICFVLVLSGSIFFFSFSSGKYKAMAVDEAKDDIDYRLVLAVIKAESGFNEKAVSQKGAMGLMQLMPSTAEWLNGNELSDEELFNPNLNIKLGTAYLVYLEKKFDFVFAIAAYNAGETRVSEWLSQGISSVEDIPYSETKTYVKRVLANYKVYKAIYR